MGIALARTADTALTSAGQCFARAVLCYKDHAPHNATASQPKLLPSARDGESALPESLQESAYVYYVFWSLQKRWIVAAL